MPEKRKLSAVLFADIVDYTALMQANEKNALLLIHKFKNVIEDITPLSNGRIVQFFGDGCLLTFESSTDAVGCAINLQNEFRKSPEVPVRIGIHMGEVLFRNDNAFGNGVNIASRIESMGKAGAILVSKTISEQLDNKPDFLLSSLGFFEFKNVSEPLEVFAIANAGFVVPNKDELQGKFKSPGKKKLPKRIILLVSFLIVAFVIVAWILNNKKKAFTLSDEQRLQPVAVMPFENLTKNKQFDAFSLMAKDWISYGLLESGKAPIIVLDDKNSTGFRNEKEKFAAIPTGVGLVINGRFFNQSDEQIAAIAEILDVKTKKILFTLDPVVGVKDSLMVLLDKLKNQVIGYWSEKTNNTTIKPPVFKAYEKYLNGKQFEDKNYSMAQAFYIEALKLDSLFNAPLFSLASLGIRNSQNGLRDSVMVILQSKEKSFSAYEKKTWEDLKTIVAGDIEKK